MDNETILKALYYQRKLNIVQFYRLNPENSGLSLSYVYALSRDCYPFFQSSAEDDLYEGLYDITKAEISGYLDYIDNHYLEQKKLSFYDLEDHFGGKGSRIKLIISIRYAALDGRFSREDFWKNLEEAAPIEGKSLNRHLDPWEL